MFEIGDEVKNVYPSSKRYGKTGEVVDIDESSKKITVVYFDDDYEGGGNYSSFKNLTKGDSIATPKTNNMSLITRLADLFRAEPQKTYRKLGILDSNDELTSEGKELLLNKLFWANEEAMVRPDAMKLLEAEEKKNK